MWLRIDTGSGMPIFRQVAAQIAQAVQAGVLQAGDKLPGVRELALELAVNPATVARAYAELEQDGVIEQPRGRGTFVRGGPVLTEEERRRRLRSAVLLLLSEAERLGLTADDALRELRGALERRGGATGGREG